MKLAIKSNAKSAGPTGPRFRHEKECFWRSETRKGDQSDHGGSILFVQLARWTLAKRKTVAPAPLTISYQSLLTNRFSRDLVSPP